MKTLDPVVLYRELTPLRHIKRFAQHAVIHGESVAEHSYFVALLAASFAAQLQELGVPVDRAAVLEGGLYHDTPEALMGDIPHPVKRQHPELGKLWDTVEHRLYCEMVTRLSGGHFEPLDPDCVETLLIKLADWAELLLYVYEEQRSGNRSIDQASEKIWALLTGPLEKKFVELGPDAYSWYRHLCLALGKATSPGYAGDRRRLFGDYPTPTL